MRRSSRLTANKMKKTRKTMMLSIVGILVILFLLFKFGITALINFSLFVSGNNGSTSVSTNNNSVSFIAPPVLNSLPTATNSAQIVIIGNGTKGQTIQLFISSKKIDETDTDDKGQFSFSESLSSGDNTIQVKAVVKDKSSDLSPAMTVTFKNSAPKLDISSPTDGQSFKNVDKTAQISGQTDAGVTITINGFTGILDENNNFSYTLPLQNGDNQIKIIAIDAAGNRSEKDLKVNYSQ